MEWKQKTKWSKRRKREKEKENTSAKAKAKGKGNRKEKKGTKGKGKNGSNEQGSTQSHNMKQNEQRASRGRAEDKAEKREREQRAREKMVYDNKPHDEHFVKTILTILSRDVSLKEEELQAQLPESVDPGVSIQTCSIVYCIILTLTVTPFTVALINDAAMISAICCMPSVMFTHLRRRKPNRTRVMTRARMRR